MIQVDGRKQIGEKNGGVEILIKLKTDLDPQISHNIKTTDRSQKEQLQHNILHKVPLIQIRLSYINMDTFKLALSTRACLYSHCGSSVRPYFELQVEIS